MSWWLAGGLLGALLVVHMARPRFERRILSSARFFTRLPPAKKGQPKLRPANPTRSRPLWLHLPILLLLLALIHFGNRTLNGSGRKGFGVWLVVDTSGSMLVEHEGRSRLETAVEEAERALDYILKEGDGTVCIRLSTFDMGLVDLAQSENPAEIRAAFARIRAQPLGTDMEVLRGLPGSDDENCPLTHMVVFSDMPAPDWLGDSSLKMVWRSVGKAAPNSGFTHVEALRDPLSGLTHKVRLSVTAYGTIPRNITLRVGAPDGTVLKNEALVWQEEATWQGDFEPTGPGRYSLSISNGGAWSLDDRVQIEISDERRVRVDWRLPEKSLPRRLGWQLDAVDPHLVVAPAGTETGAVPTLLVDNRYGMTGGYFGQIQDFLETSPLLADVNLDVVENLGIPGVTLPEGFTPVLRHTDGKVLLAASDDPPQAYVPGLPREGGGNLAHFSATVFFNAVKFLMAVREAEPLYRLTSPGYPEVEGIRLAIHPGEGNTMRTPASYGGLDQLEPVTIDGEGPPIWPMLLAAAMALFLLERSLATHGGSSWR